VAARPVLPQYAAPQLNPVTNRLTLSQAGMLPGRAAMNQLTKGNPQQQSYQNYAKLAPSGANAPMTYQSILDMANLGASAQPK
jgi:hypothetical protein